MSTTGTRIKLTTSITRTYGAVSASWGMEMEIEVRNRSDVLEGYDKMHRHIAAEMMDFESRTLPALPIPTSAIKNEGLPEVENSKPKPEWHPLKQIFAEVKKGQTFYYAQTVSGRFMRHGAPLYFDNFRGLTQKWFNETAIAGSVMFEPNEAYVLIVERNNKFYAAQYKSADEGEPQNG